ncbi:MAG: methyltransferase domain-containing protein [Giesbergeria sp.]|uniref:class I SAM-dependent methyltransferase n=1 Tax=Giesbergeria sp. TaxID=2818473 RepID=UPI002614DD80|nr:methyltransferase domain-containing protein [Giesbergeria sp.]MDD2608142.1 methyltransferase domain-containing protein [Giesbergeria sp.]
MKQTPAHDMVNYDLLNLIPVTARRIVEVGCMHGQMAREYLLRNPTANYVGIDIDPDYAKVAEQFCTQTFSGDIESINSEKFSQLFPSDCWIFGDCLEHLRDPWSLLKNIRSNIDQDGCLLACIPNAQHWSVQWRLLSGKFHYEDSGLMDKTHLRWLTRTTMVDMFTSTGWKIENLFDRIPNEIPFQAFALKGLEDFARICGFDVNTAKHDAMPIQYIFKVVPA